MELANHIKNISDRIPKLKEHLQTEEATKHALIMPFITALGYDIYDPTEVIPEFVADVGIKKGEKVDYAIKKDDQVIMLLECKSCESELNSNHISQLHRYFHVTSARFGILTNGVEYVFYSDLDSDNKMDDKPFFVFNMQSFTEHQLGALKQFAKAAFSQDEIISAARKLKYSREIRQILENELENPSEAFVKFFASQIHAGKLTQAVKDKFKGIVKTSFNQYIKSKVSDSLQSALIQNEQETAAATEEIIDEDIQENGGIVTTEDEIEGYHIVKAILRKVVDSSRIVMRDVKSYCGILLDDNNRKPICRLWFNSAQFYIGVFSHKKETKIPIEKIDEIYDYANQLIATVAEYEEGDK